MIACETSLAGFPKRNRHNLSRAFHGLALLWSNLHGALGWWG
jgi:hypothetical protein